MAHVSVSPISVFQGFFQLEIEAIEAHYITGMTSHSLRLLLEELQRYVDTYSPPEKEDGNQLRPYIPPSEIARAAVEDSTNYTTTPCLLDASALNVLKHWLLYCHAIAVDSPLQFTPTDPNAARAYLATLLSFLKAAAPLLESGVITLLEGSPRWLEWHGGPNLSDQVATHRALEESKTEAYLEELGYSSYRLGDGYTDDSEDLHAFIDAFRRKSVVDADTSRVEEQLIDAVDDLERELEAVDGWEERVGRALSRQPTTGTGRALLRHLPETSELVGLLESFTLSEAEAIGWAEEIQIRMAASAFNTQVDVVWPHIDMEEAYRLTLGAWARVPSVTTVELRALDRLLSVSLPELPSLSPQDVVALRQNAELFEEWRTALRTTLVQLPGWIDGRSNAEDVRSLLFDGTRQFKSTGRRSTLLAELRPEALQIGIGGVSAVISGDVAAAATAGVGALLGGSFQWIAARRRVRKGKAAYRHHLVFQP